MTPLVETAKKDDATTAEKLAVRVVEVRNGYIVKTYYGQYVFKELPDALAFVTGYYKGMGGLTK